MGPPLFAKRGYSVTNSPFSKLRSLQILKRKLTSGLSDKMIAQEFGVHPDTIARSLKRTLKADMIQKFEDELFEGLVPQALLTAKAAMLDGNATVALEILKGAGVLKKQVDSHLTPANTEDDLEIYIQRKRHRELNQADKASRLPPGRVALLTSGSPEETPEELRQADGHPRLSGTEEPTQDPPAIEGELVEPGD
jgi:AraC-like DNA-binding protein